MPASDDRWPIGRIAAFLGIGLALYLALLLAAGTHVRTGAEGNPFLTIQRAEPAQDWLILGSSHALPLSFGSSEARIEADTGTRILNLAVVGSGPFVWHLVAARFFGTHRAERVLIVVDGFAFRDRRWNAPRPGDRDLLPATPRDRATASVWVQAVARGLPLGILADYLTGFSTINGWLQPRSGDWIGAAGFERAPRPSDAADRARIAYLYPGPADPQATERAWGELAALVDLARAMGAEPVLLRPPLPERFRRLLPDEGDFSARLARFATERAIPLHDMSDLLPESRFYFDPDHLNRAGVEAWLDRGLLALIADR